MRSCPSVLVTHKRKKERTAREKEGEQNGLGRTHFSVDSSVIGVVALAGSCGNDRRFLFVWSVFDASMIVGIFHFAAFFELECSGLLGF